MPIRTALPSSSFIERITCIAAHGHMMMDNLSYIALKGLSLGLRRDLEGGTMPIGHLLARAVGAPRVPRGGADAV